MITVDTWLKTYNTPIVYPPRQIFLLSRGVGIYYGEDPTDLTLGAPAAAAGIYELNRIRGTSFDRVASVTVATTGAASSDFRFGTVEEQSSLAAFQVPSLGAPTAFYPGATDRYYYFSNRKNVANTVMGANVLRCVDVDTGEVTDVAANSVNNAANYGAPTLRVVTHEGGLLLAQRAALSSQSTATWQGVDPLSVDNFKFVGTNHTNYPQYSTWFPHINKYFGPNRTGAVGGIGFGGTYVYSDDGSTFLVASYAVSSIIATGDVYKYPNGNFLSYGVSPAASRYCIVFVEIDSTTLEIINSIQTNSSSYPTIPLLNVYNRYTNELVVLTEKVAYIFDGNTYREVPYNDGITLQLKSDYALYPYAYSVVQSRDGTFIINDGSGNLYSGPTFDSLTTTNYGTDLVDLHVFN